MVRILVSRSRTVILTLLVTSLLSVLVACRPGDRTWDRIEQSGILRVGLDPTFPPFEIAEGDELAGLDVDLVRAIASLYNLQTEFTLFGYDGLYDALATEQVDVLISALVIAPERTGDFAYSDSYFNAGEILIIGKDVTGMNDMEDLDGRSVAVELGARGHVEADDWTRRLSDLTLKTYDSTDEALAAVANKEADAALVDAVSGRLYLTSHPELKRAPQPVTVEPYAIVVRIEDQRLLSKINEGLAQLRASGRSDAIIARWLSG
jgi:polar amino acid transport system substrate-binding protein